MGGGGLFDLDRQLLTRAGALKQSRPPLPTVAPEARLVRHQATDGDIFIHAVSLHPPTSPFLPSSPLSPPPPTRFTCKWATSSPLGDQPPLRGGATLRAGESSPREAKGGMASRR